MSEDAAATVDPGTVPRQTSWGFAARTPDQMRWNYLTMSEAAKKRDEWAVQMRICHFGTGALTHERCQELAREGLQYVDTMRYPPPPPSPAEATRVVDAVLEQKPKARVMPYSIGQPFVEAYNSLTKMFTKP